jgi:hypothetical protein
MARRVRVYKPARPLRMATHGLVVYILTDLAESALKDIVFILSEKIGLQTPF